MRLGLCGFQGLVKDLQQFPCKIAAQHRNSCVAWGRPCDHCRRSTLVVSDRRLPVVNAARVTAAIHKLPLPPAVLSLLQQVLLNACQHTPPHWRRPASSSTLRVTAPDAHAWHSGPAATQQGAGFVTTAPARTPEVRSAPTRHTALRCCNALARRPRSVTCPAMLPAGACRQHRRAGGRQ